MENNKKKKNNCKNFLMWFGFVVDILAIGGFVFALKQYCDYKSDKAAQQNYILNAAKIKFQNEDYKESFDFFLEYSNLNNKTKNDTTAGYWRFLRKANELDSICKGKEKDIQNTNDEIIKNEIIKEKEEKMNEQIQMLEYANRLHPNIDNNNAYYSLKLLNINKKNNEPN